MSRRIWGIALLAMLPVAGVVAFILWWLSRRPRSEAPEPRAILVEQGPPRTKPDADIPTAAETSPKPAPSREKAASKGDDLRVIEGIGPKVATLLESNGIRTYARLASSSLENLAAILKSANLRFIKPTTWPEQARLAAAGEWEKLKVLQAELKGGQRS